MYSQIETVNYEHRNVQYGPTTYAKEKGGSFKVGLETSKSTIWLEPLIKITLMLSEIDSSIYTTSMPHHTEVVLMENPRVKVMRKFKGVSNQLSPALIPYNFHINFV